MHSDSMQSTIDALDDLLDAERRALLQGNLDDVSRLHARKGSLIDALNQHTFSDEDSMHDLHQKVGRNQVLLNSALEGVRSVARRLAAIRRVRRSLETYDSRGQKRGVDVHVAGSVEKRA